MKASMAEGQKETEAVSEDEEANDIANKAFQASRQAFREEEMKRRKAAGASISAATGLTPPVYSKAATSMAPSAKLESNSPVTSLLASGTSTPTDPVPRLQAGGILGDRARMEQERLARQAARLGTAGGSASASTSTTSIRASAKSHVGNTSRIATVGDYRAEETKPSGSAYPGQKTPSTASSRIQATSAHPLQSGGPHFFDAGGEYYLEGEMRHTSMSIGTPSSDRTFSPEQVVGNVNPSGLSVGPASDSRNLRLLSSSCQALSSKMNGLKPYCHQQLPCQEWSHDRILGRITRNGTAKYRNKTAKKSGFIL